MKRLWFGTGWFQVSSPLAIMMEGRLRVVDSQILFAFIVSPFILLWTRLATIFVFWQLRSQVYFCAHANPIVLGLVARWTNRFFFFFLICLQSDESHNFDMNVLGFKMLKATVSPSQRITFEWSLTKKATQFVALFMFLEICLVLKLMPPKALSQISRIPP